jgi:hypothetical protein
MNKETIGTILYKLGGILFFCIILACVLSVLVISIGLFILPYFFGHTTFGGL